MTDMAPATVSAFKRAMAHGTPIRIDNRLHPTATHPDAPRGSYIRWPKKGKVVHDGDRTWGLVEGGEVWLTITVLDPA